MSVNIDPANNDAKSLEFDFLDPNTRHDSVLIVGGAKFHVQSGLLSTWSDFFHTLFNGEFKEAKEEEIELKDLTIEQFTSFLKFIYPVEFNITKENVGDLLVLADRFMAPFVMQSCRNFLIENFETLDKIDVLEYAFQFDLTDLREKVASFFRSDNYRSVQLCPSHQCYTTYCCGNSKMHKGNIISVYSYVGANRDRIGKLPTEIQSFILQAIMSAATP